MGTIVTLPARQPDRSSPRGRDGEAAILFFTGVRYVRDATDAQEDESDRVAAIAPGALCEAAVAAASPAAMRTLS